MRTVNNQTEPIGCPTPAVAEIDRLRAELKMLHCLDVTSREGQRAFNEWRNRSVQRGKR